MRLQRYLSAAGVTSRRQAEQMILEGLVRVNSQVVTELGTKVDPASDVVEVEGRLIQPPSSDRLVYFAYHKPRGVLVSASDPEGRKTIYDELPPMPERVIAVGRLDRNSEGLLLLTNDGDLAHRLMHPSYEMSKEYEVTVTGQLTKETLEKLSDGLDLDGRQTLPADVVVAAVEEDRTRLLITLREGRKRQIRRMIESVGGEVRRLRRIREGPVSLAGMRLGEVRELTPAEVRTLRQETGLERAVRPEGERQKQRPRRTSTGQRSGTRTNVQPESNEPQFGAPRSNARPRLGRAAAEALSHEAEDFRASKKPRTAPRGPKPVGGKSPKSYSRPGAAEPRPGLSRGSARPRPGRTTEAQVSDVEDFPNPRKPRTAPRGSKPVGSERPNGRTRSTRPGSTEPQRGSNRSGAGQRPFSKPPVKRRSEKK